MVTPKWKLVEGVVHAIERALGGGDAVVTPNARVPYRNDPKRHRQVDVHVLAAVGPRKLAVGIEVKDEKRPLTVVKVEQVAAKLEKLALDRRILVSVSGFAEEARSDAVVAGLELLTLAQLDTVPWWPADFAVPLTSRQIEIVGAQIEYGDDAYREALRPVVPGVPLDAALLVDEKGATGSLHHFGIHHGIEALQRPETSSLRHHAIFSVKVVIEKGAFAGLRIAGVDHPPPDEVTYLYRLHVAESDTQVRAFEMHDRQALTTTLGIGDTAIQMTIVGRAGTLPGSVGALQIITAPAKPATRKVRSPVAEALAPSVKKRGARDPR